MTNCAIWTAILFWMLTVPSFSLNLTADEACKLTTNPSFCKWVLQPQERSDLGGYSQYLLSQSLSHATRVSDLVQRTLVRKAMQGSGAWLGALQDCLHLSQLNTKYLNSTFTTLKAINGAAGLAINKADDVHTLLSAVVTNQETCHDGLKRSLGSQHGDGLQHLVSNGSELYRASLAMFALSRDLKCPRKREGGGDLPHELRVRRDGRLRMHGKVVVAQDGSGHFRSINEAIAAAPENMHPGNGYHVIRIKAGVYEEIVQIGRSYRNIKLVGDGMRRTIITGNRSVAGGFNTFTSATLTVWGDNFVATGITIRNTAGPAMGQAVAVLNGADKSVFYRCGFEGYQDTLCVHSQSQFYRECNIYGTADFIFGDAAAVFQLCNIYVRKPLPGQANMLTAQARTYPHNKTGIVIIHSNILATRELEVAAARGEVQSYLGRPWREYSRTVIILSTIGGFINPAGWSPWGDFVPRTLYYGEYRNRGAGASTKHRVKWPGYHLMSVADARKFTVGRFIDGGSWLPATKVPFSLGLF
ncbi:putative pectinesterase 63 [Nymphaea thermarum]|nr:putative pectinesterase 63 [Nymphaea thermarum]